MGPPPTHVKRPLFTRRAWGLSMLHAMASSACRRSPRDGERAPGAPPSSSKRLDDPNGQQRPIELLTWWTRRGRNEAYNHLLEAHKRRHPSDVIIYANSESSGAMRRTLATRMWNGEPPDAFQANVGSDLLQWVVVDGLDTRESKVMVLDDLPIVQELRKVVPPLVLESASVEGHVYGIPGNVHQINCLFYNKHVLQKHGLGEPKDPDHLLAMGEKLKSKGVPLLALGSREPWTLALFVFESLLVAREGASFYRDFFHGMHDPRDARIVATLRQALQLLEFANPDHRKLTWLQALSMVVDGQAALTVMGDWSQIPFASNGLKQGIDYQEMTFPGHVDAFVFTSDAFAIPLRAKNKAGASRVLTTLASFECQRAMHHGGRTLSVRMDVDVPADDPVLKSKHEQLSRGNLALALSGLAPSILAEDLGNALAEMVEQKDIEPVLQALRSRYVLLRPP